LPGVQGSGEHREVRRGCRCDGADPAGVTAGDIPRDDPAKVVPGQMKALRSQLCGDREHVAGHEILRVLRHRLGPGALGEAPDVRGHRMPAGVAECLNLCRPGARSLGEAVQQQHQLAVGRTGGNPGEHHAADRQLTGAGPARSVRQPPRSNDAAQGRPSNLAAAGGSPKQKPFLERVTKFKSSEKPWTAKLVLVFLLLAGLLIELTMHFVPGATIIGRLFQVLIPSLFVGLLANFAARDFTAKTPPTDLDRNPVDRWSWVHHLAGWVMGLIGVPFLVVALLTVTWEVFEMSAAKFGMDEINANRMTDITLAWAGWFLARLVLGIH
jgi:hypothetical protein